jgi:hypothetical protein
MKKISSTLIISFLFTSIFYAQKVDFRVQKDGTFLTANGEGFVVLDYAGRTSEDLYKNMLSAITLGHTAGIDVREIENEIISIDVNCPKCIKDPVTIYHLTYKYNLRIQFRDGRIRINAPHFAYFGVGGVTNFPQALNRILTSRKQNNFMNSVNKSVNGLISDIIVSFEKHLEGKDEW